METTKTEALLREAQAICRSVTGREDVSDDLLCVVFRRLEMEWDLVADEIEEVIEQTDGRAVH